MTGYLIDGYQTAFGTVSVIYVDDITDIASLDEVIGVSLSEIAKGSIAYDKNLKKAVWDGSEWVAEA